MKIPPDTIILLENKEKTVKEDTELLVLDREELIIAIIALGFMPAYILGHKYKITFHFLPEEIQEAAEKLLSNKPVLIDYHRYVFARTYWLNAITLWKSTKDLKARSGK